MSERTRRSAAAKVKPHDKFAELRRLRASGQTRLSTYQVEAEEDLYEELDEDEYRDVVRKRLDEDDFVVDDTGEGYADNGMDDWGNEGRYYSDEGEEAEEMGTNGKTLSKKELKRKREEEEEKKKKEEGDIKKYFSKAAAPTAQKQKVGKEDKEFLDDLLGEFDLPAAAPAREMKKIKTEKRARALSPPRAAKRPPPKMARFAEPEEQAEDSDYGEDISFLPPVGGGDDDIDMNDAPMGIPPSSPAAKAADRKRPGIMIKKEESDDDDDFAVAEIKGNKKVQAAKVNITSTRPVRPSFGTATAAKDEKKPVAVPIDTSSWMEVSGGLNTTATTEAPPVPGKLSAEHAMEEDGSISMFWMDYTEANGSLLLFGKVKDKRSGKYVSAFLKVDGILRNLFFLPREHRTIKGRETDEEVQMEDVYNEAGEVMSRNRIENFKSKPTSRKYAFEVAGVPREGDYLKVLYPYTKPALPMDLEGETFSRVFGTNTALFEQFVLCRNIMGPCWLKITGAEFAPVQQASWCKFEAQVSKPQQISVIGDADSSEAPPLTLMSIAMRTVHNSALNKQEILAISARVYSDVSISDATQEIEKMPHQAFTVVRPISSVFPPGFEKLQEKSKSVIMRQNSEKMLLSAFLAKLQHIDPDCLMGHQLENVDYPVLLSRMKELKTPMWSRIGRMKKTTWPTSSGKFSGSFFVERSLAAGRLLCDLANDLGKSLMTKCQSWSLTEICDLILGKKRQELDNEEALKTWGSTARGFLDYLVHCEVDTFFIAAVALKIQMLPLTKQLTNLAGNSWARTLGGTRAERNEYILLHEFYRNKYICPDKIFGKQNKIQKDDEENEDAAEGAGKKKDKFKGGLVFEPEKGLYDKYILVMDFNSLYPSIIQEFNICFTTVERGDLDEDTVPNVPEEQEQGILPRLISTLVQRRRQVKNLMKDKKATTVQKTQWDIKQQALKLTANSMYGCLGYVRSRFYARPLAMLTTFKGREILQNTKNLAETMSLQVIYGDTDSVMINTLADNYSDALKIGNEFKKEVNNRYRLLEIDIDNVFQRLLLHAKKKYAAMNCIMINGKLDTKMEVKGLDMRRREYCQLSKEASSHILNEVFTGDEKEAVVERIHDYLRELAEKLREGKFPVQKYTIYTRLGKNPEEYPNGKTMPQVQVALKKKARGDPVKVGDVIAYIITAPGTAPSTDIDDAISDSHAASRAFATQDVLNPTLSLKPDPEWYLIKQIFPPIERLCAPIDGTNSSRLAECLGLDMRKYTLPSSSSLEDRELHPLESTIPDEERFKDAAKLSLRCRYCHHEAPFEGLLGSPERVTSQGVVCAASECGKVLPIASIVAQTEHVIRKETARYYEAWLVCDDGSCGNRTRGMSVYGKRCLGPKGLAKGCKGVMRYEFNDKALYNQLLYFRGLWDCENAKEKVKGEKKDMVNVLATQNAQRFGTVYQAVGKYLEKNGRRWVGMQGIFAFAAV
ncbi:hypothetical protein FPQ18DRAFT_270988 [Pyronema domesticum]|uniref:DNA polymerase n=1 Tax=Pyronema omphalodes (strain CBS 100304) TaxID=1076935 RepID=U4LGW4_PYROM|nr:hypothetical protein FPQ18DRAFT_270988 [Pyronema domesticum]CCX31329.1 Similar to DNA polymerase alpha catalytic subunit; acc. no. P28040 [Pyronema omphalodes CBS 100304]